MPLQSFSLSFEVHIGDTIEMESHTGVWFHVYVMHSDRNDFCSSSSVVSY